MLRSTMTTGLSTSPRSDSRRPWKVLNDLLAEGASIGRCRGRGLYDSTPHLAAREGETEMAQLLLQKGADTGALGIASMTPLHLAARKGQTGVRFKG